jgi:hypothetical protein
MSNESPLDHQVGGTHYKDFKIQPIEFILGNNLGFCEANVVKYICRWANKGGIQDLDKVIHYVEILKEHIANKEVEVGCSSSERPRIVYRPTFQYSTPLENMLTCRNLAGTLEWV